MIEIRPHPGPQTEFHSSPAFELLYGGRAGGGKSFSIVAEAARQIYIPNYAAILLRRTFPQLEGPGGLISLSLELYSQRGVYNSSKHEWTFSDSKILFRHLQNKNDHFNFQGHEYHYIGFDELSQFDEDQYRYLFSRCRTRESSRIRAYVRATSNPGALWVKQRWAPWLDSMHPNPAKPGDIRYYIASGDGEEQCEKGTRNSWSRTFIPASYTDNPSLNREEYERNLDMLPMIERERLKHGNWDIMEGRGMILNRNWFLEVDAFDINDDDGVRAYDLAATEKETADFTATCLMKTNSLSYRIQLDRQKMEWPGVKRWIIETAKREPKIPVVIEQEPGASGKALCSEISQAFGSINRQVYFIKPDTNKVARALVWSSQAEAGRISIVRNPHLPTNEILAEFHGFPEYQNDDMVDSVSLAWNMLARSKTRGLIGVNVGYNY